MSLSTVLFLFLAHLGVGIIGTLLIASREAGIKFFRFNGGLAAILIAIALAFRPTGPDVAVNTTAALWGLIVCEATIVLYWATIGRALTNIRTAIVGVSTV